MSDPLNIHIIMGSVREGRMALPVGKWVAEEAAKRADIAGELIDLKEWELPHFWHPKPPAAGVYTDPLQAKWGEKIAAADGFILIAPEYNHGIPGVLKNALDTVYREWNRKPVAFVAYGGVGGARAVEQLTGVARELQMAALEGAIHLMGASAKREGDRFNPDDKDNQRLAKLFDELVWWGNALKAARAG